ncbi:MAPEG family protein [soil metagenome]
MMGDGIHAAGLWAALNVILLLVLSGLTSANRRRHKVSLGTGGNAQMAAASRAFGNASEYMPIALVALGLLAFSGYPTWAIHLIGGAFFAGRLLHAVGMLKTVEGQKPRAERMFGMLLTYLPLLASAVMLIWCWISAL